MSGPLSCAFCRIVAGREPATVVREWAWALAIVPRNPAAPGHVLVIPKLHVVDAIESPTIYREVQCCAAELAVRPCNLITTTGAEATQTVPHLHVHVVPRGAADGLPAGWPWERTSQ